MTEPRPLETRLAEFAAALRVTSAGMIDAAEKIEAKYGVKASNTDPLREGANLYARFANDLDKLVAGEELNPFTITGTV